MSRGKYSPFLPNKHKDYAFFDRNAKGEIPPEYNGELSVYNPELHFTDCDPDGFNPYGYSAYDRDGKYVGIGNGIDRLGYSENDYLIRFTDDEFNGLHDEAVTEGLHIIALVPGLNA